MSKHTVNTETEPESFGEELDRRVAAQEQARRPKAAQPAQSHRRRPAPRKNDNSYTIGDFLHDERFHYAIGIIICFIAIVTAVCCFSFIYSTNADQSLTLNKTVAEVAAASDLAGDPVQNAGGPLGAKLGQWLLVDSFGVASFVFAIYLFLIGLAILKLKKISFWTLTFRCLFTLVAGSVVLGFFTYNRAAYFDLGGNHGRYANELLLYYTDWLGTFGVTILLMALLVCTYLKPIKWFFTALKGMLHRPKPEEPAQEPAEEEPNEAQAAFEAMAATAQFPGAEGETAPESQTEGETAQEAQEEVPPVPESDLDPTPAYTEAAQEAAEAADAVRFDIMQPQLPPAPAPATSEPEFVITNVQDADPAASESDPESTPEEPSEEPQGIRDGDHLGLDTVYDPRATHSSYQYPPVELLIDRPKGVIIDEAEQKANTDMIVNALRSYGIEIQRISATIGPTVTRYEMVPAEGVRIAKIRSLEDDIAMSLAALGIRIIAPIPGKNAIGIEVPNRKPRVVSMRTVIESDVFQANKTKMHLPMALGATITNEVFMTDLAKMPHLLVAGATGQGKSVGLNAILTSLLYSKHPDELKFVLIDPKMVEFSIYESIAPQYMAKLPDETKSVITDPQKALETLSSLCVEMEARYQLLTEAKVRQLEDYNAKFIERRLNPEKGHRYLPYMVIVVDEFADLVTSAGKEIYTYIARIVAKARAVGMHMILATQRPSTDVITGVIKSNFPARIAFKVTQGVDSKTILDRPGAQRLIGRGDMLTLIGGTIERVQCAFVDTPEIEAICDHISSQQGFLDPYELPEAPDEGGAEAGGNMDSVKITDEFRKCAEFTATQQTISITLLQRQFEIGFGKAARYMDQMQKLGIVGQANGAKPRQVLMAVDEVRRMLA